MRGVWRFECWVLSITNTEPKASTCGVRPLLLGKKALIASLFFCVERMQDVYVWSLNSWIRVTTPGLDSMLKGFISY